MTSCPDVVRTETTRASSPLTFRPAAVLKISRKSEGLIHVCDAPPPFGLAGIPSPARTTLQAVGAMISSDSIRVGSDTFNNNQYVDGGLYANAPGLLAVHEAQTFFRQERQQIHLLSVGTMSSKFTVDPSRNREGGTFDWGGANPANMPKRLFGLSISVQESLSDFMLKHKLGGDRYLHVDDDLTDQRARSVALDKVDQAAREVLLGSASERSKICIGNAQCQAFLSHAPTNPVFYYGDNANR